MAQRVEIPIIGPTIRHRGRVLSSQRSVNCFPEQRPDGGWALITRPGLEEWCDLGTSAAVRGLFAEGSNLYAASGTDFFVIDTNGTKTDVGDLQSAATARVSMDWNGAQVGIVDGVTGYTYTPATGTFTAIADADFPDGATQIANMNGFFLVNTDNTNPGRFYRSALRDGTDWDELDYSTAERYSDELTAMIVDSDLILIGPRSVEAWGAYDSDFGFALITAGRKGTSAPWSLARSTAGVFWLGATEHGNGQVFQAVNYEANNIESAALSWQIGQYTTISDAVGFCLNMDGHIWYVLTFPTHDDTWVYDVASRTWHEWESLYTDSYNNEIWGRFRANCYTYFNNMHLVGDYSNGKIYRLSTDVYADGSNVLRCYRESHVLSANANLVKVHTVELEAERGRGLATGQGDDPQIMFRYSHNAGATWSRELWRSMGAMGEYQTRMVWNKLGASRHWVFRWSWSDPVPVILAGAYARISGQIVEAET